jgi:hypothetical protein
MKEIITEPSSIAPEKEVKFYELEKARFIIKDATDLDVAYAYEDLVFSEHGIFILQFDKIRPETFICWFNKDCEEKKRHSLFKSLTNTALLNKIKLVYKGNFEMIQKDGEQEIDIKFTKTFKYLGVYQN